MGARAAAERERARPVLFHSGMLAEVWSFVHRVLGLSLSAHELEFGHLAARSVLVFCFAVLLSRFADRRMLGHNAGFDIMLLVVLGSVLSRAINGQAAFFPTLGASALLVLLHHVVARLTRSSHRFSALVKGKPITLVRDGRVLREAMHRANITDDDLDENLRLNGGVEGAGNVAAARLERNGSISVVKATEREPRDESAA